MKENGKIDREALKKELLEPEYDTMESDSIDEDFENEDKPKYKLMLSSSYDDNLLGVHLENRKTQKWAMDEFVAGRLPPGEMGNGIILEDVDWQVIIVYDNI